MIRAVNSISKVRSIYIMTTIFLVGLSVYTFIQILHLMDESALIRQTSDVRESLHAITSNLLNAESSKRGFLLSGDSSLLAKRDVYLAELGTQHTRLAELLRDNTEQSNNLSSLDTAIRLKIESIRKTWDENNPLPIVSSIKSNVGEGIQRMDSVSLYLDRMNRIETRIFAMRTQVFSRLSLITPIYIIVLFLGALMILFFSYFRINRELKESRRLHKAYLEQNKGRLVLGEKLQVVNKALALQNKANQEKSAELMIAIKELAFHSEEREKRASELAIANLELGFQNDKKEELAAELIIANHELEFQNKEKEKRAAELVKANKELQLFLNISSHDLQEPLRKIQMSASRIGDDDFNSLSPKGKDHFLKMQEAASSMQTLIEDLLAYSRTNTEERIFEYIDLSILIEEVTAELKEAIDDKQAVVEITDHCEANIIPFQFRQLIYNMLSNALKFSMPGKPPHILISSCIKKGSACNNINLDPDQEYCHISIKDNGIGFEPEYSEKIFDVFQRLYGKDVYKGTGIGLAIVKKIVENHNGIIIATSQLNHGATFDVFIPTKKIA